MKKKQAKKKIQKKQIKKINKLLEKRIEEPKESDEEVLNGDIEMLDKEKNKIIIIDEAKEHAQKVLGDLIEKKSMLEKMKGGLKNIFNKKNMARNLVERKNEEKEDEDATAKQEQSADKSPQVQVITFETLIANNIDALNNKIDILFANMMEGFKQVGVKFPEKK